MSLNNFGDFSSSRVGSAFANAVVSAVRGADGVGVASITSTLDGIIPSGVNLTIHIWLDDGTVKNVATGPIHHIIVEI